MAVVNEIRVELGQSLQGLRDFSAADAHRTAVELLGKDQPAREFIGLDHTGKRAVYFDNRQWCIRAIPFDETAVDEIGADRTAIGEEWDADRFLRENGPGSFTLVHPRYRWLFGDEAPAPPY